MLDAPQGWGRSPDTPSLSVLAPIVKMGDHLDAN
jgi:hypothetical protein